VVPWFGTALPTWLEQGGAALVTTAFVFGLAARTGGHPSLASGLTVALLGLALGTQDPRLLASAAACTAAIAGVLAVMATRPAPSLAAVARECGVAVIVAAA